MAAPFRLARVLHLAEQLRRLRTHEAEQLAGALTAAHVEVARLVAERERIAAMEAAEAHAGRLTPEGLQVGRSYDAALAAAETLQQLETVRVAQALDVKRAEVLRARQEEEKYARLGAAYRQRVLEEEARESDRALDEIAVDRHRRQQQKEQTHDDV